MADDETGADENGSEAGDGRPDEDDVGMLRRVADYQWGPPAGEALFGGADLSVTHTRSGRPRQVCGPGGRLVTYGTDGRFTLGVAGGRRLQSALSPPAYRVVVGDESAPYLREGRNAFAKFVREADAAIRPGDEVLVVHPGGDLLAVGRAELSGAGMLEFETGMAVQVREGAGGE